MILGMSTSVFTTVHVALSLVGILAGLLVLVGMFRSQRRHGWTALFLATTILTSASGFFFPFSSFQVPQVIGAISLVVLAVACLALYVNRLAGASRWIYVVTAVMALYLNVSLGVLQAFQKLPFLAPLASEPPFLPSAQLGVSAAFLVLGIIAVIRFRPAPPEPELPVSIRRAGL